MKTLVKDNVMAFLRKFSILILLVLFIIIAANVSNSFFTLNNFMSILQQCSITGVVAIGMTFVIITGGIDLSVGSVSALSGVVVAILLVNGTGIVPAVLAGLACGAAFGFINGFISVRFAIPSFIISMATMTSARGFAMLVSDGNPISGLPKDFSWLGNFRVGSTVPFMGILWIVLTIIAAVILRYTVFGRGLYAIGGNKEAALLSGIKIKTYSVTCFVVSGLTAAFSGILLTSWLTVGQPTISQGKELDAIAAVVLGGTSLLGGTGGVIGTFGGVFLMQIITNIFNMTGVSSYFQQIFMGLIIILALLLNSFLVGNKKD